MRIAANDTDPAITDTGDSVRVAIMRAVANPETEHPEVRAKMHEGLPMFRGEGREDSDGNPSILPDG